MRLPIGEMKSVDVKERMLEDITTRVMRIQEEGGVVGLELFNANLDHEPSALYLNLKMKVAQRVGIRAVSVTSHSISTLERHITNANQDADCHGIVLQLPLKLQETERTNWAIDLITPQKDVDGLREDGSSPYDPATPTAIVRLLEGYGIDLGHEPVAVVGLGKLVGRPLFHKLQREGAFVRAIDEDTPELERIDVLNSSRVIVCATGVPGLITPDLFTSLDERRVLVDAGTAEKGGVVIGDVSDELRDAALRHNWAITAQKGAVGPLTIASLLENTVRSAETSR